MFWGVFRTLKTRPRSQEVHRLPHGQQIRDPRCATPSETHQPDHHLEVLLRPDSHYASRDRVAAGISITEGILNMGAPCSWGISNERQPGV